MRNILVLIVSLWMAQPIVLNAAELQLASVFSEQMVLQRDMPVPVWGTANAGESVSVQFAGQSKSTVADKDGRWRVVLDPLKGGNGGALVIKATSTVTINDVHVGEVWLWAGDSLLSKTIETVQTARSELTSKEFPTVRFFQANTNPAKEPQIDASGAWFSPNRKNIGSLPALAYLFAKELQAKTQVPVGIVLACDTTPVTIQRGGKMTGSTVEAWISEAKLRATPTANPIFEFYKSPLELRDALLEYETALGDWKLKTGKAFGNELRELEKREPDVWYDYVAEMRKAGKPAPTDPPRKPTTESLRMSTTHAANLFNGMIAPLAGMGVRGVTLNLGMANAPRATQFSTLFPALIQDWRHAWGRADLPFVLVQQGRVAPSNIDPRAIAELRDAQAITAATSNSGMVGSIDLGGNIVPNDFQTLAKRLAEAGQSIARGEVAKTSGPVIEKVSFAEGQAIVQFRPGTTPLAIRGSDKLLGFAVTERPNRWAYADAKIDGDRVIVSHSQVKAPIALRYDWVVESGYEGNLIDANGLPALPYRSDDWPAFTDSPTALKPNAAATIVPADLYPVVDPSLPRVLLIGDSIMNGYSPTVIRALQGKANVVRMIAFGMIGQKDAGAAAFAAKLKDGEYALIHYNDGLHSLPPRITDEQFGEGLTAMLKHLKTVSPRVIWATTTPAPDRNNTLGPESQNATIITRNDMSKKIAAEHGVPVIDLYELVIGEREKLQGFANLHFTPEGSKLMGEQIAARIWAALQTPGSNVATPAK